MPRGRSIFRRFSRTSPSDLHEVVVPLRQRRPRSCTGLVPCSPNRSSGERFSTTFTAARRMMASVVNKSPLAGSCRISLAPPWLGEFPMSPSVWKSPKKYRRRSSADLDRELEELLRGDDTIPGCLSRRDSFSDLRDLSVSSDHSDANYESTASTATTVSTASTASTTSTATTAATAATTTSAVTDHSDAHVGPSACISTQLVIASRTSKHIPSMPPIHPNLAKARSSAEAANDDGQGHAHHKAHDDPHDHNDGEKPTSGKATGYYTQDSFHHAQENIAQTIHGAANARDAISALIHHVTDEAEARLKAARVLEGEESLRLTCRTQHACSELMRLQSLENPYSFEENAKRVREKVRKLEGLQQQLVASATPDWGSIIGEIR